MTKEQDLIALWGMVTAARGAVTAIRARCWSDDELSVEDRLNAIDEQLRTLARDVAKKAGL